jgi:hypothetical protein
LVITYVLDIVSKINENVCYTIHVAHQTPKYYI